MSFFHSLMVAVGARPDLPCYTRADIQAHNTAESLWIVSEDTVYDVTAYLKSHPGGPNCLMKHGGGVVDCARDFKFHSKAAQKLFQRYAVGYVTDDEVLARSPSNVAKASMRRASSPTGLTSPRRAVSPPHSGNKACPVRAALCKKAGSPIATSTPVIDSAAIRPDGVAPPTHRDNRSGTADHNATSATPHSTTTKTSPLTFAAAATDASPANEASTTALSAPVAAERVAVGSSATNAASPSSGAGGGAAVVLDEHGEPICCDEANPAPCTPCHEMLLKKKRLESGESVKV